MPELSDQNWPIHKEYRFVMNPRRAEDRNLLRVRRHAIWLYFCAGEDTDHDNHIRACVK